MAEIKNGSPIKVGDRVRNKLTKEYLGVVIEAYTLRVVSVRNSKGGEVTLEEHNVELAPKPTPEEAWDQLPVLIVAQVEALKSSNHFGSREIYVLYGADYTDIRHEAYKLLGGAGIKVTDEVKGRVRTLVEGLARAMGIRLI